jgi:hypothetical protein
MALTDAQMTDVRRWMGYPLAGTSMPITDDQDLAYGQFGLVTMSLHKRLTTLSSSEEAVLTATFLTNLATLETAIVTASANLGTDAAAVWTRNKNEVGDRSALFNKWRRDMCAFLGFPPGPSLQTGGKIVRC